MAVYRRRYIKFLILLTIIGSFNIFNSMYGERTASNALRTKGDTVRDVPAVLRDIVGFTPAFKDSRINTTIKSDFDGSDSTINKMQTTIPHNTLYAQYLMQNPTLCSSVQNLSIIVIVHTAPRHLQRRNSIRATWTNETYVKHLGSVRVLFLLGRVEDENIQQSIRNEFALFGDLLQGDFIDNYKNLSLKGVIAFKWLTERCRNAKLVLKVDDDVVINTYEMLTTYLHKFKSKSKQIFCNHILPGTMPIIRQNTSKWYVDESEFEGKFYPRYCSGFMVLFTNDVIPALYRASAVTPFFWVDNVYLYGLVPANVPDIKYNGLKDSDFTFHGTGAIDCYKNITRSCHFIVVGAAERSIVQTIWASMTTWYIHKIREISSNHSLTLPNSLILISKENSATRLRSDMHDYDSTRNKLKETRFPVTFCASYLIENPTLCSAVQNLSFIVIVHTAPGHFERRNTIRATWTNETFFRHLGSVRVLFLLGRVDDEKIQQSIKQEFAHYGDLLQGDFKDAYRNLTLKGVMAFKWLTERCRNANLVLKVDDDVVINTYEMLTTYLHSFKRKSKQIFCNHILQGSMPIIRQNTSKWYVDESEFGGKFYPRYCSGFMVLFTNDVIPALYRAAAVTPFLWVDDVYLFGLLPRNVPDITYNGFKHGDITFKGPEAIECYTNSTRTCNYIVVGTAEMSEIVAIWTFMTISYKNKEMINSYTKSSQDSKLMIKNPKEKNGTKHNLL